MVKYKALASQMVDFFKNYDAAEGIPSFEKFAESAGVDGEELARLSGSSLAVGRAYRQCIRILRDRLTDGALLKRYDSSFCKYTLDALDRAVIDGGEKPPLEVEIRVV